MAKAKRMTVSLSPETVEKLEAIAEEKGITFTEALRLAIATEDYLRNELKNGGKVLIQKKDNTIRELVFR